ncbi:MAG: hypothetical protein ACRDX9_15950 [Acidimicrobiia bacterium]
MRLPAKSRIVLLLALTACGIAETKLPPEPTVEYLPCTTMTLEAEGGEEPFTVLIGIDPDIEQNHWGGGWMEGEVAHIGLTDVGVIDWEVACPRIGDQDLVVHEVPFTFGDLEMWAGIVRDRIGATIDSGGISQELVVDAGQWVIEIRADTVEIAASVAEDVPLDAWTYRGPVSGSG